MREFSISETFIKEVNRIIFILCFFWAVFFVVVTLHNADFTKGEALVAVGRTLFIIGIILLIFTLYNIRELRKSKIFTDEEKLVQQSGKKQYILMWDDITRIKLVEKRNGDVDIIRLYLKKPKRAIHLIGFGEMNDLANLIRERTLGYVVLQKKRVRLDFGIAYALLFVSAIFIVMSVIALKSSNPISIFAISTVFFAGHLLLILKPLTKSDLTNKWVELAFVAVLLILGFYGLIVFLLSGKLL